MFDYESISLALTRVTESVAFEVMPLSGKGEKERADHIAVETMRAGLEGLDLNFHIHLGEGEKDQAPMLYTGERLGKRKGQGEVDLLDLVVDPLECTTNFSRGLPDSMTVILAAPAGTIRELPGTYMDQLLVPPPLAEHLDSEIHLDGDVEETMKRIASILDRRVEDITVVVQDRPRHQKIIEGLRRVGAGISLIESGSISAAAEIILRPHGRLDMLWGRFGAPEGLIIAAMANLSGYGFSGRMAPHNEDMAERVASLDLTDRIFSASGWIRSPGLLVMTGIHSSTWLQGVERYFEGTSVSYRVQSLVWSPGWRRILTHTNGRLVETVPFV